MRRGSWLLAAMIVGFGLAGCSDISTPDWSHPGTAVQQRVWAERFNPYPETRIGPEIEGARPREFQQQVTEPARTRWPIYPNRQ